MFRVFRKQAGFFRFITIFVHIFCWFQDTTVVPWLDWVQNWFQFHQNLARDKNSVHLTFSKYSGQRKPVSHSCCLAQGGFLSKWHVWGRRLTKKYLTVCMLARGGCCLLIDWNSLQNTSIWISVSWVKNADKPDWFALLQQNAQKLNALNQKHWQTNVNSNLQQFGVTTDGPAGTEAVLGGPGGQLPGGPAAAGAPEETAHQAQHHRRLRGDALLPRVHHVPHLRAGQRLAGYVDCATSRWGVGLQWLDTAGRPACVFHGFRGSRWG